MSSVDIYMNSVVKLQSKGYLSLLKIKEESHDKKQGIAFSISSRTRNLFSTKLSYITTKTSQNITIKTSINHVK